MTMTAEAPRIDADVTNSPRAPLWASPALWLGRFRPALRAAAAGDAVRLRELPSWFASLALPVAAIGVPVGLSILHALRPIGSYGEVYADPTPWTVLIWTTFTESVTFVLVAAAIGLLSPAAGVLVVLAYGASDLAAALVTNEMLAFPGALIGRLSSYVLLWLLVVEIPVLARQMFEAVAPGVDSGRRRRAGAVVAAAVVTGALAFIWAEGARQLIGAVHLLSNLTVPAGVYTQLYYTSPVVAVVCGVLAGAALWVRYLGVRAHPGLAERERPSYAAGSLTTYIAGGVVALLLLVGYVDQPIDAVILIAAIFAARPIAGRVLRVTRLAPLLIRIPWPIRFVAGFVVAFLAASTYLTAVGISPVSRFGYMVIAIAGALFLIELFLAADDAVGAVDTGRGRAVAESVAIGTLLLLAIPMLVAAHSGHQEANAIAGSAAAGGAAAAAAAARNRYGQKPKPRGPEMPDFDKQQQENKDNSFWRGPSNFFKGVKDGVSKFFGK